MRTFLLQIVQETVAVADSTAAAEGQAPETILQIAQKGGVMLIPIIILSLVAIYILVERYSTIKKAGKLDKTFLSQIKTMVLEDNIKGAQSLCQATNTPIARMLEKGLSRIGKSLKDVSVAVENVGNLEVSKLEKGMPWLATIAGVAPMVGLLGTVTGLIKTFRSMASEGDNIAAGAFSTGIYEAMVTTVAGLIVGIVAYISYNILTSLIDKVIYKMEASTLEFLDILHEPAH